MISSFLIILFLPVTVISCTRSAPVNVSAAPAAAEKTGARAAAILQTGEHPLWFQLTEEGPVLLETIEDAVFSAALVPWPLALHVRSFLETDNELVMAVNRDGFIKLAPSSRETKSPSTQDLAMYRFSGGSFFRQYTIGGFVFYDRRPAALLYLDDRFLDSSSPLPSPRTWSFNMESNTPFPLDIPALEIFPAKDGWDADTLRPGTDGMIYYRVIKKRGSPVTRMFRAENLSKAGKEISLEIFYGSLPRENKIPENYPLPPLPEGIIYTGAAIIGNNLFASWEEQEEYNIGAAGFMLMKPAGHSWRR